MIGLLPRCTLAAACLGVLAVSAPPAPAFELRAENVATGFVRPVFATAPTGDPDRLFVVEKRGVIKIIKSGSVLGTAFLDIQGLVHSSGNEQGLLGLAFDPDYGSNGFFYVYYTRTGGSGISQVSRFSVSASPDVADAGSELRMFNTSQPYTNHNGGHLEFGADGYLYFGTGDGGSGNDPGNRAQNGLSYMGKMLRFDVTGDDFPGDPNLNYAIPASNPFVGNASFHDEIWAYGLRNPYRYAFDESNGDMYIADVGQNCWEELDWAPGTSTGGENYGWRIREGSRCFSPANAFNCNNATICATGMVQPFHEFNHSTDGFSCSVTGGRVYNGDAMPALVGTYFYADYCSDQIYTLRYDGSIMTELLNRTSEFSPPIGGGTVNNITAFGRDGLGELYIVKETTSGTGGTIFKIVPDPATVDAPAVDRPQEFSMTAAAPNPFSSATQFQVRVDRTGSLDVTVYDAAGRRVRTLKRGVTPAGVVPLAWDGRDLEGHPVSTGVYFVRAEIRDKAVTKRVTLIR